MFVERSSQYTSFSSRKPSVNAGGERKQFTENASVTLQRAILTHAHTKCPPVTLHNFKLHRKRMRQMHRKADRQNDSIIFPQRGFHKQRN